MHVTTNDISLMIVDLIIENATTFGGLSQEEALEFAHVDWIQRCFAQIYRAAYINGINGITVKLLNEPKE